MKKCMWFCLMICAVTGWSAQVVRGPYLEDPTQTTLILRWQTNQPTAAWLEYGPAPRCNQIMKISPEGTDHKAVLYGLVPNQAFCYKLHVQNQAKDGLQAPIEGSFRTLYSPERKEIHFLGFGHTAGENTGAKVLLSTQMAAQEADFVIHTGDITASGLNAEANKEFFIPYQDVLMSTPLFIAMGASEYGPDRANQDSKSFVRTNYTRFHNMSWSNATPKYYSFDTGNARFIFLDTNSAYGAVWAPELGEGSAQYKWLQSTLASAPEKWKIVVLNAPLYSTGEKGPAEQLAHLVPLFEKYRVNLVLQGAETNYERTFPLFKGETNPRGVTYVTLGGGGTTPTRRSGKHPATARFVSAYHYADFRIVDRKLVMQVYNEKGKQIDKLELYL